MALPAGSKADKKEQPPQDEPSALLGVAFIVFLAVCCWYGGVALTNLKAPSVKATFDKATTTCVSPFSNLEQTDGQKDGKRGQCFKGHSGSVLIELIEPLHLEEVFISFNKQAGKTRPKHVVFFGSEHENGDGTVVSVRISENATLEYIPFSGEHAGGNKPHPVKFLKVVVLSNWGAPITTFENVQLNGFKPVVVKVFS